MFEYIIYGFMKISATVGDANVNGLQDITFNLQNENIDEASGIAVVGILFVFFSLLTTALIITGVAKIIQNLQDKKGKQSVPETVEKTTTVKHNITGELNAAISTALYLYFAQAHDKESSVLTIEREPRHYSPWSSKIYNIRKLV